MQIFQQSVHSTFYFSEHSSQSGCKSEKEEVLYILYLLYTLGLGNTKYNKEKMQEK